MTCPIHCNEASARQRRTHEALADASGYDSAQGGDYFGEPLGDSDQTEPQIAEDLARAETLADASSSWIAVTQQRVAGTAEVLRRGVTVPLYVLTVVCELDAVVPLVMTWYVTG